MRKQTICVAIPFGALSVLLVAPPGAAEEPQVFVPTGETTLRAPDGRAASNRAYPAEVPLRLLDDAGSIAIWFRLDRRLRGEAAAIDLVTSSAFTARIESTDNSIAIDTRFERLVTGAADQEGGRPYSYAVLLTYLNADQWYHAVWTWDRAQPSNNAFFLDGISQEDPPPMEKVNRIKAGTGSSTLRVGGADVVVGALCLYETPLSKSEVERLSAVGGHKPYTDEGVRFSGEKFVPSDVDWDHPVYATSFEDPAVQRDWRLEGGAALRVTGGNLVLENGGQSSRSEKDGKHLVCWLDREMPADFLLEFTVRPEDRLRGLNIVFFNARGIGGENIFKPPIKSRNGNFSQYHSGDIDNYHISYWSGGRGTSNLRKNKGFYLVAIGRDLVEDAPAEAFQTIRVYKRGGMIRLMVDDVVAMKFDDDGKIRGPVHTASGWIGLRQMAHTRRCEYGHFKVWPLK